MELLDVTLTTIQRRNRAAFIDRPGLAMVVGEKVVLRDEQGEYFAGSVVDCATGPTPGAGNDPDGAHPHGAHPHSAHSDGGGGRRYLVHVGVRLPEAYAMLRLGRVPRARTGRDHEVDALLDLLGDARQSLAKRVPSQRAGSGSRS